MRIACTKRDAMLLEKLGRFGVLSTAQIGRIAFEGVALTTVRRRLRLLEKSNLIFRVPGLEDGGLGWCLTTRTAIRIGVQYPMRHFNRNTLRHEILLNDVRLGLEGVGLADDWTSEHVLRARAYRHDRREKKDRELIPDGLFSAVVGQNSQAIAVELELSGKNRKRYEQVLGAYKSRQSLWAVWYIVGNETLGKTLQDVWRRINRGKRNDLLFWSPLDELLANPYEVRVHSEHFKYPLRQLVYMRPLQPKMTAPRGAPPESRQAEATKTEASAVAA